MSSKMKKAFKIIRTLPLDIVAGQIADDVTAAIYSSIGNKTVTDLREGDELDEVVEQSLNKTGMADTLMRLSSTRIEIKVGVDASGSMFQRGAGSPIVRATTLMRLLRRAFLRVSAVMPQNVFKSSFWLWATGWSGNRVICLDSQYHDQLYSTIGSFDVSTALADPDKFLEWLGKRSKWQHEGGGTYLAPLLNKWGDWENNEGDPTAHRLDLVITDGQLHDYKESCKVQNARISNHYRALFMNIAGYVGEVPMGFTGYRVGVLDLERILQEELISFVSHI